MSVFALFITPGVRDAAAAKLRYDGDDEAWEGLSAKRIAEVAEELKRAHGMAVEEGLEREGEDPPGIDLEEVRDVVGFDARVDRSGVMVSIYGGNSAEETEGNAKRGIAAARTAARLLGAPVYDTDRERLVDLATEEAELTSSATESLARPDPMVAGQRRANAAALWFGLIPFVCIVVTRTFLRGFTAFLVMFGVMAASGAFAAWWVRRPTRRKVSSPPPPEAVRAPKGNEPIRPS